MSEDPVSRRQDLVEAIAERREGELAAGVDHIARHFTDAQIACMAETVPIPEGEAREKLLLWVEAAAGRILAKYREPARLTPSRLRDRLDGIETTLTAALDALGVDDPYDGMPSGPVRARLEWAFERFGWTDGGRDGEAEVLADIRSIGRLRDIARSAREDAAGDVGPGRHKGDVALNALIADLLAALQDAGINPGLSRHPGTWKPGGPTFRFVKACLTMLAGNFAEQYPGLSQIASLSDEALAKRIRASLEKE